MTRKMIHQRSVKCVAYERDDGLLDIEGTLIDEKPFMIAFPERGEVKAGEPIHKMVLQLTISRDFVIANVVATIESSPYRMCSEISERYRQLIGQRIGPGFSATVKRLFAGTSGCTHMTALLPSMATTAYQAVWGQARATTDNEPPPAEMPGYVGSCHTWRRDGDVVQRYYPQWYRAADEAAGEKKR